MKKQFADYTWLAGTHGGSGSLWQGPDHLLVIEGKGLLLAVSEVYRRLDYKNIQALTLTPTRGYIWMAVLLGVGALIFALLTWATLGQEIFIPISLGLPAGLLLILLAVHLARGQTCACTVQTSVQVLRLKALGRLHTAQPVIQRLEALCMEHQKGLPVVEPGAVAAAAAASGTAFPPSMFAPMAGAKPPWSGSGWVLVAGLLAIAWALLLGGELFMDGMFFTTMNMMIGCGSAIVGIVALVRSYQQSVPGGLATALWGGLAMHLLAAMALFALAVAGTANAAGDRTPIEVIEANQRTSEDAFKHLALFQFDQAGPWGWAFLALALILACLGAMQLMYAPRRKAALDATPAAAPPPPLSMP
ncbi:MAG: hypothetical protein ACAH88_18545 [Roseimicrobium sp.]